MFCSWNKESSFMLTIMTVSSINAEFSGLMYLQPMLIYAGIVNMFSFPLHLYFPTQEDLLSRNPVHLRIFVFFFFFYLCKHLEWRCTVTSSIFFSLQVRKIVFT